MNATLKGFDQMHYQVLGGKPLFGSIRVIGAKNAALPIIISTLLTEHKVTLHNVPRVSDVDVILAILAGLGTTWKWIGENSLQLQTAAVRSVEPQARYVIMMRASFEILGALLGRAGEGILAMPGGCSLGPRPVDQHIKGLEAIGVKIQEGNGKFLGVRRNDPDGTFRFEIKTVGGTRNVIMASALGRKRVVLENALLEPEVTDLIDFLNTIGAAIVVKNPETVVINGVEKLRGGEFRVIPDRIEAGTYMLAAAATRGCVTLKDTNYNHLEAVIQKLSETGTRITRENQITIKVDASDSDLKAVDVVAKEYPNIPTDLNPQMAAFLSTVEGASTIEDRVFHGYRFSYADELAKLGVAVEVRGNKATIYGGGLRGGNTMATDLRAGSALMIAALSAPERTSVYGVRHILRGYQGFHENLRALGASVVLSDTQ